MTKLLKKLINQMIPSNLKVQSIENLLMHKFKNQKEKKFIPFKQDFLVEFINNQSNLFP